MSKKVLVISSSPRKNGNSDKLCGQFIKGAVDAGNNAEKIFLKDYKIGYCQSCYACVQIGKCVIKDDMEQLLAKMMNTDVIVLATPVYFYTMSAQLKTFIDRVLPKYQQLKNKEFYVILTAGDTSIDNMKKAVESLRGFYIDCLENSKEKKIIYGVGTHNVGDIDNKPAIQEAYEAGKNV